MFFIVTLLQKGVSATYILKEEKYEKNNWIVLGGDAINFKLS